MLEDARPRLRGAERADAMRTPSSETTTSSPGSTVRMKVAPTMSSATRLGGEDHRLAEPAHHQRPDAERIAAGDHPLGGQADQRIGAFDLLAARR